MYELILPGTRKTVVDPVFRFKGWSIAELDSPRSLCGETVDGTRVSFVYIYIYVWTIYNRDVVISCSRPFRLALRHESLWRPLPVLLRVINCTRCSGNLLSDLNLAFVDSVKRILFSWIQNINPYDQGRYTLIVEPSKSNWLVSDSCFLQLLRNGINKSMFWQNQIEIILTVVKNLD